VELREDLCTTTRVYVQTKFGDPAIERLKATIGWKNLHYDKNHQAGRGLWWAAKKFRPQIEKLLADGGAADVSDPIDRAMLSDRLLEQGRVEEAQKVLKPPQVDPDRVRLVAKVKYKGRTYYATWLGVTKRGNYAAKLVTLPNAQGGYEEFWADCVEQIHKEEPNKATILRMYTPHEIRRYGRLVSTEYQTLGRMARFLKDQKDPGKSRGQCTECGHWGPSGEPCSECGGEGTHV
jgi:hypothetical protein